MRFFYYMCVIASLQSAYAIYDTDPDAYECGEEVHKSHPYVCFIKTPIGHGSGSYIAPNIILTSRHVLTEKENREKPTFFKKFTFTSL